MKKSLNCYDPKYHTLNRRVCFKSLHSVSLGQSLLNPLKNYELKEDFIILAKNLFSYKAAKKEHFIIKGCLLLLFLINFFCSQSKNYIYLE